ncbi:MAG: twin-arginine translocase TatA/TatE family subunit [Deltaproteobacteria bacterium]|nr:twin-arginine translocase TatA/TatE family subunit [Deltaproteobacteria bacterium]
MFNMGGGELFLVGLVALLLIGPRKLPEVATQLGRWLRDLQRGFEDVKKSVREGLKEEEKKEKKDAE